MTRIVWLCCLLLLPGLAQALSIGAYENREFRPADGEAFSLPVHTDTAGELQVELYTSDGDRLRTLAASAEGGDSPTQVQWDGRDADGEVVPDEAYIPVLRFQPADGEEQQLDPRDYSGGEVLNVRPDLSDPGRITFQLEQPARILARAGVKSGPMLNSLATWEVRSPGRNVLSWSGFDRDKVVDLRGRDDLAVLLTGFALPDHAILTRGNEELEYSQWREANGWSSGMPDLTDADFQRDGERLSRQYYLPRSVTRDPVVSLEIVDALPRNDDDLPVVSGPISLRVDMREEDRWAMQQSLYEVAFFLDFEFLSEEEQGYVPLTWRWDPAGLAPGTHFLTTNVSGFNGQVGVQTLQVEIAE